VPLIWLVDLSAHFLLLEYSTMRSLRRWLPFFGLESRLEGGGVNRANLKFKNLIKNTSRVSVRNIIESEREGAKQIASE
jgi:hypothetical protein